jgi:hypothetical protein
VVLLVALAAGGVRTVGHGDLTAVVDHGWLND